MATLLYSAAMAAAFQQARVEADELTQAGNKSPQAELVTSTDDQSDLNTVMPVPSQEVGKAEDTVDFQTNEPIRAVEASEMTFPTADDVLDVTENSDPSETSTGSEKNTLASETGESNLQSVVTREAPVESSTTRGIIRSAEGQALVDLSTDKGSYRPNEDVRVYADVKNTTETAQNITVTATINHLNEEVAQKTFTTYLEAGQTYKMKDNDITFAGSNFKDYTGYLMNIAVTDASGNRIGSYNRAIAVETDWTKFPRYGIVSANNDSPINDSISVSQLDQYKEAMEKMKNMNINSYFYYDVYNTATDPFPDKEKFIQVWNTWNKPTIDTSVIKELTKQAKDGGAISMLYNMILAESIDENGNFPNLLDPSELVYNNYEAGEGYFGKNGEPMTYSIEGKPFQRYYSPYSKEWQEYIAKVMVDAMERGGFDGWQGDTIGDTDVAEYHQTSGNRVRLSDGYDDFLNGVKDLLKKDGKEYYLTLNDVNGEHINTLKDAKQDVVYDELWTSGSSAIPGRQQTEYGDLKARVDEVRAATGKSLIVGAYMVEANRGGLSDEEKEAIMGNGYMNQDALLLTTATISAAGGYHMSSAASAGDRNADGIGVLQTAFYPDQKLTASQELNRKVNDYNQFVTAYENLLRDGVENEDATVNTLDQDGKVLSWDKQGVNGHQVWTYSKQGDGFRTIHMLNLMDINSDWKNERGWQDEKNPTRQENLTVRYELNDFTMAEAERMAKNTYLTSPDDWSKSEMVKANVRVETGENGKPVMVIDVPKLELWNMIYIDKAEPMVNTYKTEEGQEVSPSSRTEGEKELDGYVLVATNVREDGTDYVYRKVETVVPTETPSVELPMIALDTYKTEDGQELAAVGNGEKTFDGYVLVATSVREDGKDYVYRKLESQIPTDAPSVQLPSFALDTYKTEDGQELALPGTGEKAIDGYELVATNVREDGTDFVYRKLVAESESSSEAPAASDSASESSSEESAVSDSTSETSSEAPAASNSTPELSSETESTDELAEWHVPVRLSSQQLVEFPSVSKNETATISAQSVKQQKDDLPRTGENSTGATSFFGMIALALSGLFAAKKKKSDE